MDGVAVAVREALCGPNHGGQPEVVWSDGGAQVLLHVGRLQVRTAKDTLVVAVDTETAEFGVAPLMVRFVFGSEGGPASLVAATDAHALGHPQVVARWGELFRDVVWAGFARLVEVTGGGNPPIRLHVDKDRLEIGFDKPFSVLDLAHTHVQDRVARGLRPAVAVFDNQGRAGAVE
ncbi:MAG: hypothetical protein ACRDWY_00485 [Actinomycetes bacterium]